MTLFLIPFTRGSRLYYTWRCHSGRSHPSRSCYCCSRKTVFRPASPSYQIKNKTSVLSPSARSLICRLYVLRCTPPKRVSAGVVYNWRTPVEQQQQQQQQLERSRANCISDEEASFVEKELLLLLPPYSSIIYIASAFGLQTIRWVMSRRTPWSQEQQQQQNSRLYIVDQYFRLYELS